MSAPTDAELRDYISDTARDELASDAFHCAVCTELLAARQRIAELEAERQWRPISTAPLVYPRPFIIYYDSRRHPDVQPMWVGHAGQMATHWMPLPAPPKGGT